MFHLIGAGRCADDRPAVRRSLSHPMHFSHILLFWMRWNQFYFLSKRPSGLANILPIIAASTTAVWNLSFGIFCCCCCNASAAAASFNKHGGNACHSCFIIKVIDCDQWPTFLWAICYDRLLCFVSLKRSISSAAFQCTIQIEWIFPICLRATRTFQWIAVRCLKNSKICLAFRRNGQRHTESEHAHARTNAKSIISLKSIFDDRRVASHRATHESQ